LQCHIANRARPPDGHWLCQFQRQDCVLASEAARSEAFKRVVAWNQTQSAKSSSTPFGSEICHNLSFMEGLILTARRAQSNALSRAQAHSSGVSPEVSKP